MSVYLGSNKVSGASTISVTQKTSSGTNIADITIGNTTTELYAPSGETMYDAYYDYAYSYLDARGVNSFYLRVTPVDINDCTLENVLKIKAYHYSEPKQAGDINIYPLIITYVAVYTTVESPYVLLYIKSIYQSVQSTSSSYLPTGYIHVVAPFEIDSVTTAH